MDTVAHAGSPVNPPGKPIAFQIAPRLTHKAIASMNDADKDRALHECVDLLNTVKRHVFNPVASPQTRVAALALIIDRAAMTARGRLSDMSEQAPMWIGDKEQAGSMVARLGISRNSLSNELTAMERAGLLTRFRRKTDDGNVHIDISVTPALLTDAERLPGRGDRPRRPPVVCPDCGSVHLARYSRVVCADCGSVLAENVVAVNRDEETETEETAVAGDASLPDTPPLPGEVTTIEQAQQSLCTSLVHNVSGDICTPDVHNGNEVEACAPAHVDVEDTPPAEIVATWLEKRRGQGALIKATGKESEAKKYITLPGDAQPDYAAYLAGALNRLYGSRLADEGGRAWVWCSDIDERDQVTPAQVDTWLSALARAGAYPVYWQRRAGRGHLELYFDEKIDPRAADAWALSIVPELAQLPERYPVTTGDRPLSWPLYYRIENTVHAATARYALPGSPAVIRELTARAPRDEVGLHELAILVQECVTSASLCPPPPAPAEAEKIAAPGGGEVSGKKDKVAPLVIEAFNKAITWEGLVSDPLIGGFTDDKFLAAWRGDVHPNCTIDPKTDKAKDFSALAWPGADKPMDRYEVWTLIEARRLHGPDVTPEQWRAFKRADLAARCQVAREGVVDCPPPDCPLSDEAIMEAPPDFCIPGSALWQRLVAERGLAVTVENARAWYRDRGRAIPPGVLRQQVLEE